MDERDPNWCHTHQRPGNDGHEQPQEQPPSDQRTGTEQHFQPTAKEQRFLQLLAAGHIVTHCGRLVGWSYGHSNYWLYTVRQRFGLRTNYQVVAYAHDRYWIRKATSCPAALKLNANQRRYLELLAEGEKGTTIPPLMFVGKSTVDRWMELAVFENGARNVMQLFGWTCGLDLITLPAELS